jgi:hypothetical protein
MKVDRHTHSAVFRGEDGDTLRVTYDNRGEPYREGVSLTLTESDRRPADVSVFLEEREMCEVRDLFIRLSEPDAFELADLIIQAAESILTPAQLDAPLKNMANQALRHHIVRYRIMRQRLRE